MVNWYQQRKMVLAVVGVLVMTLSLTSCDTLRKKFTRKKKQDQNESSDFIPVLEPQDYPAPEHNPVQMYQQHYSLIKAWYKDLWTSLDERDYTGRRTKYVLKEIFNHIDEMEKLVKSDRQPDFIRLRGYLEYYNEALDEPLPMRNTSRIQSDLRAFDRQLRDHLRIDKIKAELVLPTK